MKGEVRSQKSEGRTESSGVRGQGHKIDESRKPEVVGQGRPPLRQGNRFQIEVKIAAFAEFHILLPAP